MRKGLIKGISMMVCALMVCSCIACSDSPRSESSSNNSTTAKKTIEESNNKIVKEEPVQEAPVAKEKVEQKSYDVKIISASYDEIGFGYYVRGTITNNRGDVNYIQVEFPLYDANGNKVGTALANCSGLKTGETWIFEAISVDSNITTVGEPNITTF